MGLPLANTLLSNPAGDSDKVFAVEDSTGNISSSPPSRTRLSFNIFSKPSSFSSTEISQLFVTVSKLVVGNEGLMVGGFSTF